MWQGGARFEGRMGFGIVWNENDGECVNLIEVAEVGFVERSDSWMKILGENC